jgi:enoyl-CoA hydratase/carnithine racemase
VKLEPQSYAPEHFGWGFEGGVATVTLNRPERKNPLTFDSYAELRDTFRALVYAPAVKAVVVAGAGGNFSSGGDVHEIIGPLTEMQMPGLLAFTRMTGDLVKAMRACPQPIISALDGVCVGAGAIMAMASDIRLATPATKTAFLFTRVARGLASGPTFAHGITKTQLGTEWAVSLDVAIEMEAQAQAICMATNDFRRAFEAFAAKRTPEFEGN